MNCECRFPVHCALRDGARLEDKTELDEDAGRSGHEDFLNDVVFVDGASVSAPLERVVPDIVPGQLLGSQAVQCVGIWGLWKLKAL